MTDQSYTTEMLLTKRQYIIDEVKTPLMKSLISFRTSSPIKKALLLLEILKLVCKYPAVTRHNNKGTNAQTILDIEEKFFQYENNPGREPLFRAIFRIWAGEMAHDNYYEGREDWILEEIIKALFNGKWMPRKPGHPKMKWWREPEPYGGQHSIVYKLWLHRDEILKIIGVQK
jgi:hypothetical protein